MSDSITYSYRDASVLSKKNEAEELFLSQYNETQKGSSPCFFYGNLSNSYITSRCLIALSNVVQSSFNLSPFQMALLKDPIVSAGNEKIRFEGFSHCAGVYARVDVLPNGHSGEFLENGTTNVDFNQPMINSLSGVRKSEQISLSVGKKEVAIYKDGEKTVERKVPLPAKWIKGLTSVQVFLADSEEIIKCNRLQALKLFKTLPKVKTKTDYYLLKRGSSLMFSALKSKDSVYLGGAHRLRLLEPLLPLIDELKVYAHKDMQSTTWQLYFGDVRYTFSLSRDAWRGFSGEGAGLESLIEDVPNHWVEALDNFSYINQEFNPTWLSFEEGLSAKKVDNLSGRLAAMGLLGFDLEENAHFYRRLPFKLDRIMGLNPRIKGANKLLEQDKVIITSKTDERIEARVEGSGVHHTVIIHKDKARCTCTWFSQHQGERGACKHILATKKILS